MARGFPFLFSPSFRGQASSSVLPLTVSPKQLVLDQEDTGNWAGGGE